MPLSLLNLESSECSGLISCLYVQEPVRHDQPVSTVEAAGRPGHGAGRAARQGRLRRQEAAEDEKSVEDSGLDQAQKEERKLFSLRKDIHIIIMVIIGQRKPLLDNLDCSHVEFTACP